jgi:hypothetical protein
MTEYYQELLKEVRLLNDRYLYELKETGESFNTFRILKLDSAEVRLHSAFIAELLNVKGSHGYEDTFLNFFLKALCFKGQAFNSVNCQVEVEKHTAFISPDGMEGGRLDIVISDGTHQLIIENKIYAGDRTNQLVRYHNYAPSADLLYLTLYGNEPEDFSKGTLENGTHFKCYSYKTDIISWLEKCKTAASDKPIVRESIVQYINLIKYLTNQSTNHQMAKELNGLIKLNLQASFNIHDSLDNALDELLADFVKLLKADCQQHGLRFYNTIDFEKNFTGLWISKKEWKYVNIGFQFQRYDLGLIFGMVAKEKPDNLPAELRVNLSKITQSNLKPSRWWPWQDTLPAPYDNWSKYEAWNAVENGSMRTIMMEKIKLLLELTADLAL